MKRELNDVEVNEVSGGAVVISAPMGIVGFNQIGEIYEIKGNVKQMRNLLLQMYDENEGMNAREFDILVRDAFKSKGWI